MNSEAVLKNAGLAGDADMRPATSLRAGFEAPSLGLARQTMLLQREQVAPGQFDLEMQNLVDVLPEQTGQFNSAWWGHEMIECQVLRRNGAIVAGASLITRKIPVVGSGIAFARWGPAWRRGGMPADPEDARAFIREMQRHYCEERGFHLTIMPAALPGHDETLCRILVEEGFSEGEGFAAPERYLVNTGQAADAMIASLDQKWRYNLKKAKKHEFKIEFVDGDEGIDAFNHLYDQMHDRKKFLDSSAIDCLGMLMRTEAPAFRPRVVLVSHEGRVTAGGVFAISGEIATYMFGATDDRALRLRAGYAMHGWVAEHLCADPAVKWYDLGGNDLDKGLHQFKKGFVGKTGHILNAPPRFHFAGGLKANLLGSGIFKARDMKAALTRKLHALRAKQKP